MKVLIVGSGGREHAIAASAAKSSKVEKMYCAPGNAGIAEYAECVDIGAMEFDKLTAFAKEAEIDLVIVGMDDPLVGGLVDELEAAGIRTFGPRKNAAILEGSKAFSKDLMKKYNIPTAGYENFTDPDKALTYLETAKFPIVLKADGLALGKGVLICNTLEEAKEGVKTIMLDKKFGSAGNEMVIEEFMTGREVSVLSFVDGKTIKTMTSAQDHKRAGDGDTGLNTGGMGTFSPSPFYTKEVEAFCNKYVYQATVDAMAAEGRAFKGVIFFGLMLTEDGPKVLEYNARFGDPEAQVVLPRMKNDLIEVVEACIDGTLDQIDLQFEDNAAVCVVLASDGYPVQYDKGFEVTGLEEFKKHEGYYCFHAGTKFDGDKIVTNGGRVLGITAKGKDLKEARANAYAATEWVKFENKYMRHDIGKAIDEA
ncbi:phosphoribosylamine--glycine ligase [Eubacterium sp. am_0171]|uniref:Phosphoribosylamine--glycine ligase n=1 Tax=Faecalicatena contorta TaxID=39482 RepID=A0A174A0U4_9FIRM|nr:MULTISPECIES: phosphoribosylamine--glycine ligase [Clostridia]MSC85247.1 phosphoribosylamine--glycine ligase [Eubacterium sp. BIOML-A1]MSD07725.1 phosphoribosylamine--glycine ligase [Eubacterium sp. BIOML-A2]RYT14072.1 phosphoribosylamine--glycine ligase [Eubacterium sp. am_0171]CUN81216.1 Phosphoribosylamine--glycine ligase [[Eubacterium] contortum] [Faecalicatena contorta]